MLNFSCPECAEPARVIELITAGGENIVRFQCDACGVDGVDNQPVPDKPAPRATPWREFDLTSRKPPKPPREKRDKPQRPPKPPVKAASKKRGRPPTRAIRLQLEEQAKAALHDYIVARKSYRAKAISRAKSDFARDTFAELLSKLREVTKKKDKVVA
jgi:rubredoxin